MNKRLEKRHKRQVSRARQRVKVSEPDLRTPEQVSAARELSRSVAGPRDALREPYSTPTVRHAVSPAAEDTAKVDSQ
jgi:hypothetical protein